MFHYRPIIYRYRYFHASLLNIANCNNSPCDVSLLSLTDMRIKSHFTAAEGVPTRTKAERRLIKHGEI